MQVGSKTISRDFPPYFIAEISGNHLRSLDRCFKLVDIAHKCGASAVKLQTLDPKKITLDTDDKRFIVTSGPWKGQKLAEIYRQNQLPIEWHSKIFDYAKSIGIDAFSSPFDVQSIDFLEKLNVPAFKIASNELFDWPIIERVCKTKKPIFLSTGIANKDILQKTLSFIRSKGGGELALLYCISAYPPKYDEIHLNTMLELAEFGFPIGLSDHSISPEASISSIVLGGVIVEKHFTISRKDGGSDAHFSLNPIELKDTIIKIKNTWKMSINGCKYPGDYDTAKNGIFTRQLWTKHEVKAGDLLTWDNIMSIRGPQNSGAEMSYDYEKIIGKRSTKCIPCHQPLKKEYILSSE